jgi:hypothetical protein
VSKRSLEVDDQQLTHRLGPVARRLLEPESDEQRADAIVELGTLLEFALCELMRLRTSTAGFWCDGVELRQITSGPDGRLQCVGAAWCAKNDDWLVPILVDLSRDGPQLVRVDIRLGDGDLDNLAQHKERALQVPSTWLERYSVVAGQPDPDRDALAVIAQLQQWLADNPLGRIVRADWEYVSGEAAVSLVREEVSSGRTIVLEPTWLDGAPAVRIARRS